jgi:hypothetical protein
MSSDGASAEVKVNPSYFITTFKCPNCGCLDFNDLGECVECIFCNTTFNKTAYDLKNHVCSCGPK